MFTNSKLAKSVKLACAFGAASTIGFTGAVNAQETEEAADAVEKIEVTGSRIRRTDIEGANPVTVMSRVDIEKFGITSIGDVLQAIPSAGSAINTNNNNGGNGTTTINIRGIGSNRTLVLVNGKRWAPGLTGSVDLNNIPASIIERIEVLKDGASAVYGSDAVAGVVNIITRQDFEGVHASGYIGQYDEGDGNKEQWDIGFGTSNDKGNVYFNISYVEEEPTLAGDREISAVPTFGTPEGFGGSSAPPQGRFWTFDQADNGFNEQGDGNGGLEPWVEPDSRFNFAPFNYLSTPQERTNIYTQARYELTDNLSVNVTGFYGNRKSEQALAPTPLFIGTAFGDTGFTLSADNPFSPYDFDVTTDQDVLDADPNAREMFLFGRRMMEAGFRSFKQNVDQFQFNGGFEGVIEFADREFFWDANYTYADITQNTSTDGLLNMDRVAQAIGDPANCTGECTPLNLFGGAPNVIGEGTITQEMLDYITFTAQDELNSSLESYSANISGELLELPAGYLAFASGYEKRWQSGYDQPDAIIAAGITSGNARQPTSGAFSVEEVYLELAVPLLSDMPGVEQLDLELATRYSDYSNFGDTTNSKIGLKWRINDDLLVRGTWSEAFRAPSLDELFSGNSDSFAPLTDPCNGGAAGNPELPGCAGIPASYEQPNTQIRTTVGGNANLEAEEAESFTYGFVYSPEAVEGLSITFDIFDIEVDNAVSSVGAQTILNACAQTGVNLCSLIERGAGGNVVDLFNGQVNLGGQTTSGFDYNVAYNFETEYGDFRVNWDGTYVDERTTIVVDPVTNTSTEFNDAGLAGDRDVVPRLRTNLAVTWAYDDWTANWLVRFIGHTTEECSIDGDTLDQQLCSDPSDELGGDSFNELEDMAYHDVSLGYAVNDNLRITLGVNNLFDTDPEVSYSTFANSFDPSMYEIPGQFFYSRVNLNF
ncbi:TonB-dependent receptor [Alteromonas mediterranea]|uniref:TonB-dependent receptor n=2 Tax=Alteromonas mediterranea TaxID=314275 RepID=A0AAC9ACT9_9ALTE|nr:TonB-dependent receptor [Alteromonas mediterranea]MBR9896669.1 TonB-dependent receptor [Gammaproteobacteria bacterium]AEA97386.1 TonB-denpendent receptor [Alteromonas mediterranea DE]AFV84639.1 TonB-dependent receptor [Alteromonas mediterranea DE1]AGP96647.1 TonB-dependent receptor [Alteromonas mediterranea UM7]AGQ00983.1 TonB-dependent receptor [Alteromonas mediterranea UM4b]